jgi:hypothetical protein
MVGKLEEKMLRIRIAVLGLVCAASGAMPLFAGGVGTLCDGKFLFKMNIIGVENGKNPTMNNPSRKTIFVRLGANGSPERSDIFLTQGPFSVCDGNSWDQAYDCNGDPVGNFTGSVFQLPCNLNVPADFTCDGGAEACYDIYFRALGTPGGGVTITTCGIDANGDRICSSENTGLIVRNHGTPTFKKVTNELSSLVGCVGTTCGRFALFRDEFQFFLWQYDNQGLRNGMVVFCGAECD